ncbi:MAG: hypothetical protein RR294_05990 [Bacilli bacterium]
MAWYISPVSSWNGQSGARTRIYFAINSISQSVEGNYSACNVSIFLQIETFNNFSATASAYLARDNTQIEGNRVYFRNTITLSPSQSIQQRKLGTTDFRFYHNNDGTGTANIGGWSGFGYDNYLGIQSITLPKIDRFATFSYGGNFTDEQNPLIAYSNPAQLPVNLRIEFSGVSINRRVDVYPPQGQYWFTLTEEERNLLRQKCTSNTLPVRLVVSTIINGQEANWSVSDAYSVNIINANPVLDINDVSYESTNLMSITGNNQKVIKGYSNVDISINKKATPLKYATLGNNAYIYEANGNVVQYKNESDALPLKVTYNNVNIAEYGIKVIDSRGNQSSPINKVLNIINYELPKIKTFNLERGNKTDKETFLNFEGTFENWAGLSVNNVIVNVKYRYAVIGTALPVAYNDITLTTNSNGKFSLSKIKLVDLDIKNEYIFEFIFTDKLDKITYNAYVNSAKPLLWFKKTNKKIGIGSKPADTNIDESLQCQGQYAKVKQADGSEKVISIWEVI